MFFVLCFEKCGQFVVFNFFAVIVNHLVVCVDDLFELRDSLW